VKRVPPPSHPTNPYKEGTKKFLVAQRLIAGERDRKKIAREVGVSVDTTYTVVSDLRAHGYSIGASGNSKSTPPAPPAPPAPFSPAHQQSPPSEIEETLTEDGTQESYSPGNMVGDVEDEEKYVPGDVSERKTTPRVTTRRVPQQQSPGVYMTKEQIDQIVEQAMQRTAEALTGGNRSVEDIPQQGIDLPIETVITDTEKVNLRLSLDPEIFFRYNVFKARVKSLRGR
jgi:hypothetical protein